jgi:hypothetical protein
MRFRCTRYPKHGDNRLVRRFLWLPKRVSNERRWLEVAAWQQRFAQTDHPFDCGQWRDMGEFL